MQFLLPKLIFPDLCNLLNYHYIKRSYTGFASVVVKTRLKSAPKPKYYKSCKASTGK